MNSQTVEKSGKMKEVEFGILFDIDGVIARGYVPLTGAKECFKLITDASNNMRVPVAFVTNALSLHSYKAGQLTEWVGTKVHADQMVMAHSPLTSLTDLHHKHCLVVGQGPLKEITAELGFTNVSVIEDVAAAYKYLDVMDHAKRNMMSKADGTEEDTFPKVDEILLIGEPKHWETSLQLVIDMLLTNGKPFYKTPLETKQTLPLVACNPDLLYMHRASFPRLGHGAFLLTLESIFKKVTGHDLQYKYLVGKPSEISFRYSEHVIAQEAQNLGITQPIKRLYMIGDNQQTDIYGANLYNQSLQQKKVLPASRSVPSNAPLLPPAAEHVSSILVKTGIYNPEDAGKNEHGHRDFVFDKGLLQPEEVVHNVLEAVEYIVKKENFS